MDHSPFPVWFFPAAIGWVIGVILLSAVVRKRRGKPLVPNVPADALYVERRASARWASNCLLVWVSPTEFGVVPKFPFNLAFLPEIYGLERHIPIHDIESVETKARLLGSNIVIRYRAGSGKLGLKLANPRALAEALGGLGVSLV